MLRTHKWLPLAAATLLATLVTPIAVAAPAGPLAAGGSNYDFYNLTNGCDREAYGTVDSFDRGRDTITTQLRQMYDAGQRRLRIGIFHQHGPDSGTVMDSSTGDLSPVDRQQLVDLLAAVKSAGFQEIELAFHPQGADDPHNWDAMDDSAYQEDWGVISKLHPLIAAAGIPYRIDLLNEGMPMSNETVLRSYAQRLWSDYTGQFGSDDTVGFSMTVWIADRATQLPAVYGDNPPDLFDVHLYGDSWNGDEYSQFVDADKKMTELGYHQQWIIGETYFDDGTAADGIRRAIADTGRSVRYLTQWPLTRAQKCSDVDQAPPVSYAAFSAAGF
ncbi:hypothetical protein [Kutzneria kofuensis]|uniref:Cellulase (Glycosyl hydrolase family 5) n=1 Tax=Kutzneria kofuensis TaxID=103725 RepID=A0A7W9NEF4_9PSEU|nr:hypothetical protein [Kutzneria kofuensis]MBB5888893.1 hypothetical protein [Kutzneria kofuensis]